jgi:putative hydrolase of the HAD superfamily
MTEDAVPPLRAVLFDVGNTLAHLDYDFLAATARRFRPDIRAEEVARAEALVRRHGWPAAPADQGLDGFFAAYVGAIATRLGLPRDQGAAWAAMAATAHRDRAGGLWDQVDPDAHAVLSQLAAAGLAVGAVSNADGRVEQQLHRMGLGSLCQVVVDSARAGVAKPDPRIFRLALASLAVSAAAAVYVGDIFDIDVRGARAAGMRAVLYDRWDAWPDADVPRVRRLGALPQLLGIRKASHRGDG